MIGVPITIKNHNTGQEITINDHSDSDNVIALQSFPNFEKDVRNQNVPRQGSHGEFNLPHYYGGLSITFEGIITGETQEKTWEIKTLLDEILALPKSGYGKELGGEDITPAFAINESTNPTGEISTLNWDSVNSTLEAITTAIKITTSSDLASGMEQAVSDYDKDLGDVYHSACDIKNNELTDRSYRIRLEARGSGGTILASAEEDYIIGSEGTERAYVSLTLPDNILDLNLVITRLQTSGATTGDEYEVSKVMIIKNPPSTINPETDYFDGNTPDLTFLNYDWTGNKGLSATEVFRQTYPAVKKETVRISFTNPEGDKIFLDATPIRATSYNRPIKYDSILNWQVILRASFPYLLVDEDNPKFYEGLLGFGGYGFYLPTNLPFMIDQELINPLVINTDESSFLIIRIYGSDQKIISNPTIRNVTNNQEITILKTLDDSSEYFIIDGVAKTVKDQDGNNLSGFIQGDFIELDKGQNNIIYIK